MNETHDPNLRCWVPSAHDPATDFPIQNLPFGVFKRRGGDAAAAVGVAIGDQIVDIAVCHREGFFEGLAAEAGQMCQVPWLNGLMALGSAHWSALRLRLSRLLRSESRELRDHPRRERWSCR